MSKKSKSSRPNLPEAALARARAELSGEVKLVQEDDKPKTQTNNAKPTSAKVTSYGAPAAKAVSVEDLKREYIYVIADLRSMGILAGVLFVGLVVVSLIIV